MAYDERLANRIREQLVNLSVIEEKEMMGGFTFMVNDKMCIGVTLALGFNSKATLLKRKNRVLNY